MNSVASVMSFLDASVTLDEHSLNEIIRDAIQMQTFSEQKDTLRLFVGVSGIQYAGVS